MLRLISCLALLYFCSFPIKAQTYIQNPSFEGETQPSEIPEPWQVHNLSPDTGPGFDARFSYISPSDGGTYVNSVVLSFISDGEFKYASESFYQELVQPFLPDKVYRFTLDLVLLRNGDGLEGGDGHLYVFGGEKENDLSADTLATIINMESYKWEQFEVLFSPQERINYLLFEPFDVFVSTMSSGYIMAFDNISEVEVFEPPQPKLLKQSDTVLCIGESITLDATHPYSTYRWNESDTDTNAVFTVTETGSYKVEVKFGHNVYTDSVYVEVSSCDVEIPNIITPNADEINEWFTIPRNNEFTYHLKVFNRWGRMVYGQEDYENNWQGEGLRDGSYFYELSHPRIDKVYTGWVEIRR